MVYCWSLVYVWVGMGVEGGGGSPSVISLAHTNHAREREDLLTLKIHVGNE